MADDDRTKGTKTTSSRASRPSTSTAGSRAAQRRVKLPGSEDGPPKAPRVVRPKRPWYKRGAVWFWIIVAQFAVALTLSYVLDTDPNNISLEGGDRAAFCAKIRSYHDEGAPGDTTEVNFANAAALFQREADAYRDIATVAPDEVRQDFLKVAALTEEVAQVARDFAADPTKTPDELAAMGAVTEKQGQVSAQAFASVQRINTVVLRACDLDLTVPADTGTTQPQPGGVKPRVVPGDSVPGLPGTAPATATTTPTGPGTTSAGATG